MSSFPKNILTLLVKNVLWSSVCSKHTHRDKPQIHTLNQLKQQCVIRLFRLMLHLEIYIVK